MIIEFEVSPPFQRKPGYHRTHMQRRWWWLWFAVAITKGDAKSRQRYGWEERASVAFDPSVPPKPPRWCRNAVGEANARDYWRGTP